VIDISLQRAVLDASAFVPKNECVFVSKVFGRIVGILIDEIAVQFLSYESALPGIQAGVIRAAYYIAPRGTPLQIATV
jgi:hypothetical protein